MRLHTLQIAAGLAALSLFVIAFLAAGVGAAALLAAVALIAAVGWAVAMVARRRFSRARDNTA
jgi:Zn-dependent protease with chaperone function